MIGTLRKSIVTIAAVLLSAGLAACPCLAATSAAPTSEDTVIADVDDAHRGRQSAHNDHSGAMHEPGEHAPSHQDHSACDHCDSIALAKSPATGDGIAVSAKSGERQVIAPASILPSIAILAEVSARYRHRWVAPPTLSPVSLKIRLRN